MTIDQEPIDSPQGWVADHVRRSLFLNAPDRWIVSAVDAVSREKCRG